MTDLTNELRRLAQAATPGPWILLPVGDKSKCFAVADINLLSVLTVVDECGTSFGAVYLDGDAKFIAAANPATVSELLDRLEDAESDGLEQARLNGMGASREAALMTKLEAAEKERGIDEQRIADLMEELNRVGHENDALRAEVQTWKQQAESYWEKIAEMERQEPVAWVRKLGLDLPSVGCVTDLKYRPSNIPESSYIPLYLAPGAKGE